jgi:hypothetical protein
MQNTGLLFFLTMLAVVPLAWPTNAADFWSMVSALSSAVVAILAGIGLRSLSLTKRDIRLRNTREAAAGAIKQCELMADKLILDNSAYLKALAERNIALMVKSNTEVRFDPDNADDITKAQQWMNALPAELRSMSIGLCNDFEAWSMHFTKRVADHEIAYGPCAVVLCLFVIQHFPVLLALRNGGAAGKYPNLIELYKDWLAQLEHENRGLVRGNLLKQAEEIEARMKKAPKSKLGKAIGTDLS